MIDRTSFDTTTYCTDGFIPYKYHYDYYFNNNNNNNNNHNNSNYYYYYYYYYYNTTHYERLYPSRHFRTTLRYLSFIPF